MRSGVIGAGLRGAGNAIGNTEVAAMNVGGGAAGYLAIVARLLTATFAPAETPPGKSPAPQVKASPGGA